MTIARRMWIASAVLALLVAAAFGALLLAVSAQRDATAREARSKDVTVATLRLEKLVVDLETGIRGLTVTGREPFLDPYERAREELPERIDALQGLVAEEPRQLARARALNRQISFYVDAYAEPLIEIVRNDPEAARQPDVLDEGKRYTDDIRQLFADVLETENAAAERAAQLGERRSDQAVVVGGLGIAGSTLLIVLFGIVLARSIGRPVRAVASGASRVAAGDLSLRLPAEGPGEVGELTRAFNEMAERLEQGRAELEEQNAKLRESERMMSELVSIVSHELRTPLASVLGFTALLLKREFDPPERRHYLGIVDAQARRLAALLEDFLDVQRIEREGVDLTKERIDVAALLEEQAQLYAGESPLHRVDLALVERPLLVRGDRNRLAQVVGNLLSNAIKYSPDGGTVELVAEREGEAVRVTVRDEGRGIPLDQQDRIFTKFFRGDAGATGITGTGLGLAVSRDIVEAHGGRIGFDSRPGVGSTFWIELPSVQETAVPDEMKEIRT
jgi:two-component system OmpR family sensor kinase